MKQGTVLRMVDGYIIRRASQDDVLDVIAVNLATLPEHYSDFFYYDLLRGFPEGFLVAELEGSIVGYIMCRLELGFSNFGLSLVRKGHVVSIAVMEGHRRKGLGKALMEEAMIAMKARGCREAFLEVRVSNAPAIELYKRLGFVEVRRVPYYYRDGETAMVMAKRL